MPLTDEERRRIQEEEEFRAQVRGELETRRYSEATARDSVVSQPSSPPSRPQSQAVTNEEGSHASTNCPRCHRIDQVQKITAVVSAGLSTTQLAGTIGGGSYNLQSKAVTVSMAVASLKGSQTTALSQRLLPPPGPTKNPFRYTVRSYVIFVLLCLPIVTIPIALVLLKRDMARHESSEKERLNQELLTWEAGLRAWEGLYYCARCDGVFLPGDAAITPPSGMGAFLRREGYMRLKQSRAKIALKPSSKVK